MVRDEIFLIDENKVDCREFMNFGPGRIIRVAGTPDSGVTTLSIMKAKAFGWVVLCVGAVFFMGFIAGKLI